jgi:hypothetical protein
MLHQGGRGSRECRSCVSNGRSIHAVSSITPSLREGIEDGPRLRVRTRSNRAGRGRPEDHGEASAEIDVAAVTVEASPQTESERPLRAPSGGSAFPPSQARDGALRTSRASNGPRAKVGRDLDAARCGARVKVFDLRARNARAGGGGGRLERLAETALGRRLSSAAKPRRPPRLAGFDRSVDRSSKQLPTNQHDTDNAEKHEPNEIHPEDYGVGVAYDQSIAASTK